MAKIWATLFAQAGDKQTIPVPVEADGTVSVTQGWTPDYELPDTDPNYKPVGREEMNGVINAVTDSIKQLQLQGAAEWSSLLGAYPKGAEVIHAGERWYNPIAGNTTTPGAVGATWITPITGRQTFTANGSFVVPGGVDTIYASGVAAGAGGGGTAGCPVFGNALASAGAGGGGAGDSVLSSPITVVPGETLTIEIGGGGAGGTAGGAGSTTGGIGGAGGTTRILRGAVVLLTLAGGLPGNGGNAPSGAVQVSGGATGGNPGGSNGGSSIYVSASGAIGTLSGSGGNGASTPFGTGARGGGTIGSTNSGAPAQSATGYGSGGGGGGGSATTGGAAVAGGAGSAGRPGILFIEY